MYKQVERNGRTMWYLGDELHRFGEPAMTLPDGTEYWYKHGKIHREGGPAVTCVSGSQLWYNEGLLHRTDGPAITDNGKHTWYLHGEEYSFDEYCAMIGFHSEDKLLLQIKYSDNG